MNDDPLPCDWKWEDYFCWVNYLGSLPLEEWTVKCLTCGTTFHHGNIEQYYQHLKCANLKPVEYQQHSIDRLLKSSDPKVVHRALMTQQAIKEWYTLNPSK